MSDSPSATSGHVNVVAEIVAKPGHEKELRELLVNVVGEARKENGCVFYHLHVDKKNPAIFYTYEEWSSDATLATHLEAVTPLIVKHMPIFATPPKITPLEHLL